MVGKLSKGTAKIIGIKQDGFIAQLDIDQMAKLALQPRSFTELPKYPSTDRDIALIVDNNIPASDIIDSIVKAGGKIVVDVFPFDLYKGKNIAEGKKSIALRIVYRSDEKTLTDAETDKVHEKVIKEITNKFKAELRA
jgi:phenylalanyl-tRNA synthetase beta chain